MCVELSGGDRGINGTVRAVASVRAAARTIGNNRSDSGECIRNRLGLNMPETERAHAWSINNPAACR